MKILLDWWKSNGIVVGCPANLRKLGSAPCQQTIQKPHNEQLLLYWTEEISSEGGQDLKGKLVVTQIHPIFYVHLSKPLLSLWNHAFTSCAFSQQVSHPLNHFFKPLCSPFFVCFSQCPNLTWWECRHAIWSVGQSQDCMCLEQLPAQPAGSPSCPEQRQPVTRVWSVLSTAQAAVPKITTLLSQLSSWKLHGGSFSGPNRLSSAWKIPRR